MSSREAGNRRQSVCWHLCFYIYEARSVFHAYVCISERHGRPWRPSADISVCEHRWILSKSHYTGQNEDAGCENAVAYGYFISPMFFNYLTCSIPFFLDSHFGEKKRLLGKKKKKNVLGLSPAYSWSWYRQLACTLEYTYTTCDLFPSCTNTWLIANPMRSAHSYSLIHMCCWLRWRIYPNCWRGPLT